MKVKRLLIAICPLLFAMCTANGQNKIDANKAALLKTKHPNILVIITDQQRASMLSCAGNKYLKTPAEDSIAAHGIRFTRAYCTNPVCCPSRFSIQTGLFPSAVGMRENEDHRVDTAKVDSLHSRSMGNIFREAGYQTYYGGKVHLPTNYYDIKPWGYNLLTNNPRKKLAELSADFLMHRKNNEKPFLLFVSILNPHDICYDAIRWAEPNSNLAKSAPADLDEALSLPKGISKKEFFKKYCPPLPLNHQPMFGETSGVDSLLRLRPFREKIRKEWTDEDWRMHRWAYLRLTERADSLVGIIMNALKKSGLDKNTIVIFTSDHGENDGSHKLDHKTVFYEEATNIPILVSDPWMQKKGIVDSTHLVSNGLDLLPTLCDFAGIQTPPNLSGKSLVPLIKQEKNINWRKHLFEENQFGYLIRTIRYKYELDDMGEIRQMFVDLKVDPGETANLINDYKYDKVIDKMRKKLLEHLAKLNIAILPPVK